jgi:C1A family cysteine protease
MMKLSLASLAATASASGSLTVSFADCGDASTHGVVTDVEPKSLVLGQETDITGTGTVDEDVTGGSFTAEVTAAGVIHDTLTGDICTAKTFDIKVLGVKVGTVVWKGMSCPIAAGATAVPLSASLASAIPASLAHTTVALTAQTSGGDKLVCLNVDLKKEDAWEQFKADYGKNYGSEEESMRKAIFEENMEYIKTLDTEQFGITEFADMSQSEFQSQYLSGLKAPSSSKAGAYLGRHVYNGEALPASVDWSTQGAVTPVKNQGSCGSCWSFSTTGSLEGAAQIATGKLVALSEQQFVDCDKAQDQGCNGGLMDSAFTYAEANAICTEEAYPYAGKDGTCQTGCAAGLSKGQVTGFKDVATDSENDLMSAVAQQPVSIAVDAETVWQFYLGKGVITSPCGASLDHGVLAVGYGTWSDGTDYWKVKNSWGGSWGMNGYVLLKRGKGGDGECGLLKQPSYPVVASTVTV